MKTLLRYACGRCKDTKVIWNGSRLVRCPDCSGGQVKGDLTFIGTTLTRVHGREECEGREIPCCIHRPSAHHMAAWPMNWRSDTRVMERICPHGTGHPDPDHMAYVTSLESWHSTGGEDSGDMSWQGVHGCDGCCQP